MQIVTWEPPRLLAKGVALLSQRGIFPSSSSGHTHYFLVIPFMDGTFWIQRTLKFSNYWSVSSLHMLEMFGVLLAGLIFEKYWRYSKEECEPKSELGRGRV